MTENPTYFANKRAVDAGMPVYDEVICPVAQLNVATMPLGGEMHTWQAVAVGKSGMAHQGMLKAAEVLAHTVIEIFENPSIAVNAKVEHIERTNGHAYVCPLPDDYAVQVYEPVS